MRRLLTELFLCLAVGSLVMFIPTLLLAAGTVATQQSLPAGLWSSVYLYGALLSGSLLGAVFFGRQSLDY